MKEGLDGLEQIGGEQMPRKKIEVKSPWPEDREEASPESEYQEKLLKKKYRSKPVAPEE